MRVETGIHHLFAHRSKQAKTVLTPADAITPSEAGATGDTKQGIPVSQVKKLDTAGLKIVSLDDLPELRDRLATMWLDQQAAAAGPADIPDNAPQNVYATVTVNGQVVATLYNSGCAEMTNEAAGRAGELPNDGAGPLLAQQRAEYLAKALGGMVEKAPTAISQSEWTPRESVTRTYTREQLDEAFEAMKAAMQNSVAARNAGYATLHNASGLTTNTQA